MIRLLFFVLLLLPLTGSFSQKIPLINSGEVIEKGKSLYDSAKYAEAIKTFYQVPERDTNYVLMLTEAAITHIAAEQYEEVLSLCAKGLSKPSPYVPYFLRYQAIAEDKKGNYDQAVKLFQSAIKRFPADYSLLYNLGITYYNHKEYERAMDVFFQVLAINPFHSGSHLNLGRMSIGQGRKVHAMLSFGLYLSVANTDNERLVLLNNFLDNQVTDEGTIPLFGLNEPEKLDQVIRAKIAMDKNFKFNTPVDAAVVRQFELFFQQLKTVSLESDDPWIKTYMPIYRYIQEQNLVEPFIYHLLSSSANAQVKKWLSKNDKTLKAFYQSVNSIIKKQREIVSSEAFGFSKPVQAWFDNNNTLDALGEYTSDIRKGVWVFYHDNHEKSAEGIYSDKGEKEGTWKYYNNDGTVKSVENYATGEVTLYYPSGIKREYFHLKKEKADGEVQLFYPCGPLKEKLMYQEGERHGKGETYHTTGEVSMTYQYVNNKAEGEFKTFYVTGEKRAEAIYKEDRMNGVYRSFHANGKPESEGAYVNDLAVGLWIYYYFNGKTERKGTYKDSGNPVGEWVYYDEEGMLTEKRQFDEEGRLHGPNMHYDENTLHYVDTYKKDLLIQSVFYDRKGKEIARYGSADGSYATRNYFATGQLQSEGAYKKGKAHGLWKYYNRFGKLISEYNYVDGLLQGKATNYFTTGAEKYRMEYNDNKLHGYFQEFYKQGGVKAEGWFQKGNREQQWLTYFLDGTLETDSYYLLNDYTGPYYTYSLDGKLYSVVTYEDKLLTDIKNYNSKGSVVTVRKTNDAVQSFEERFANKKLRATFELLCGKYVNDFTKWYPDGSVYYSYSFRNGKKYGAYAYHDATGQRVVEGNYVDDREEGLWKTYHLNGQLAQQGLYLNGAKDSVWNYYFPNGKGSSSVRYRKDKLHGVARYYSPEGMPLLEKKYLYGDLIAYRPINENEETESWQDFSGTGVITVRNAAGKVVYEENFQGGLRHGYKRLYFLNGKLQQEYQYRHGDKEGPYVVYYADGKVQERGTFEKGELEGKLETFHPDGKPEKSEQYRMGTRHGKGVYTKGNSRKEYMFWDGAIE